MIEIKYLTGIRAYAALSVLLVHLSSVVTFPETIKNIVGFGQFGVIIFFVLSSYTITLTFLNAKRLNWGSYLIKRFFRIFPLLLSIFVVVFLLRLAPNQYYANMFGFTSTLDIAKQVFVGRGFIDYRYANVVLGTEWTIYLELVFYLLLPWLFFYMRKSTKNLLIALLAALSLHYISTLLFQFIGVNNFELADKLSIFRYIIIFASGIALALHIHKLPKLTSVTPSFLALTALMISYVLTNVHGKPADLFFCVWTVILIYICYQNGRVTRFIFENPVALYLGKISYSIYLVHFILITKLKGDGPMHVLTLILLTFLISTLTFYLVEEPSRKLGRYLAKRYTPVLK